MLTTTSCFSFDVKQFIFVTFSKLKEDRSSDVSDEQPENMLPISVTAEVSNPVRSKEASDEQSENMTLILVTAEVSNPVRSKEASDEQS